MKRASFGERLRAVRESRDCGVRELARATGISPATISRTERGIGSVLAHQLPPIADALQVSIDYLLRGREATLSEKLEERAQAMANRIVARELGKLARSRSRR